jgi:hypothetical protein
MNKPNDYIFNFLDKISMHDLLRLGNTMMKETSEESIGEHDCFITESFFENYSEENSNSTVGIMFFRGPLDVPEPVYFSGISAPLLIRSLSKEKEIDGILNYFKSQIIKCSDGLGKKLPIYKDLKWPVISQYANFYLITNLKFESSKLKDYAYQGLRNILNENIKLTHANRLNDIGIFCADTVNNLYLNEKNSQIRNEIHALESSYNRLIFEIDTNGKMSINSATLSGYHCLEIGENTPTISKITTPTFSKNDGILGFEELINSSSVKESDLQKFLERHPDIIKMNEYSAIYSQIAMVKDDGEVLKPDFILEPQEGFLASILDIKLPNEKLFIRKKNRERFSAKIYEYAAQLREYGKYFESPSQRKWFKNKYGIDAFRPKLFIIAGKNYSKNDRALMLKLKQSIDPVEIITYDQLLNKYLSQIRVTKA